MVEAQTGLEKKWGDNLNFPFDYEYTNAYNASINPSTMHAHETGLARMYRRYLTQKAISTITIDGQPDTWENNYLMYGLFLWGHLAVIEVNRYGVIPQWCTLAGFNIYRQPTKAIIANPVFKKSYRLTIGDECEMIKLAPDYGGLYDLISYYADLLAITSETMGVNVLNSKLSYVFAASSKASQETFKKLFDRVASGEPAAVIDKDLFLEDGTPAWQYFAQDLNKNYIAPDLLQTLRQLEAEFDTIIGIPNANTDKRERLITDEVNANNTETMSRVGLWIDTINDDLEKVNKMFGLNLKARYTFEDKEVRNAEIDTERAGSL